MVKRIPSIACNLKVQCHVHNYLSLSWARETTSLHFVSLKICFNVGLPSCVFFFSPLSFSVQTFMCGSLVHKSAMSHFLIMQFLSAFCYFLSKAQIFFWAPYSYSQVIHVLHKYLYETTGKIMGFCILIFTISGKQMEGRIFWTERWKHLQTCSRILCLSISVIFDTVIHQILELLAHLRSIYKLFLYSPPPCILVMKHNTLSILLSLNDSIHCQNWDIKF